MKRRIIALALVLAVFAVTADSAQAFGRRCCKKSCYVIKVAPVPARTFEFVTPYDFTANTEAVTAQPETGNFAIKLNGDSATIATFEGEEVKFTATCQVLVPASNYAALKKTTNPLVYLKKINVPLKATTLDAKGVAEFSEAEVLDAVDAELKRIRFWDQPSLFGLEKFNIKVTGVARVGGFIFKNSNHKCLTGKVK